MEDEISTGSSFGLHSNVILMKLRSATQMNTRLSSDLRCFSGVSADAVRSWAFTIISSNSKLTVIINRVCSHFDEFTAEETVKLCVFCEVSCSACFLLQNKTIFNKTVFTTRFTHFMPNFLPNLITAKLAVS